MSRRQPPLTGWWLTALLSLVVALTTADVARAAGDKPTMVPKNGITTLGGELLRPDDFTGKVVLFDFWATWCKPCVVAIPHLGELAAGYAKKPFRLVSVSSDLDEEKVRGFVEEKAMHWPQVWDDSGSLANRLHVVGYPTYVLFDHQGQEIFRVSGWGPAIQRKLDQEVEAAIEEATKHPVEIAAQP